MTLEIQIKLGKQIFLAKCVWLSASIFFFPAKSQSLSPSLCPEGPEEQSFQNNP